MLLRAKSGVRMVVIGALPAIECASLGQIVSVACHGLVIEIDTHHVLEVVTTRAEFRSLRNTPTGCLLERRLVLRNVTFDGLMLESAHNLALEALRRVVRVALTIEILGVDARDEASVSWDALVTDVVHGTVHPGHTGTAHVTAHGTTLRLLLLAIDGVGAHGFGDLLVLHDGRSRVDHGWFVCVAEVLTCLSVGLAGRLTNDILLLGDEAGIAGDFQATLHFALFNRNKITIYWRLKFK